ncbi:MAG: aldehyde dehydrogenase family protein [Elusimicrobiota bacterium]
MAELVRVELTDAASAQRLAASAQSAQAKAALSTYVRARILSAAAAAVEKEAEAFARLIVEEVKKPIKEARREVARAVFCLGWAAEECRRISGELLPLDLDANSEGRFALVKRVPRGPALFITPFNFPLNLVVHKVAPAIAVGLPFVLKPDPRAKKTAAKLLQILLDAGWPAPAAILADGPIPAIEAAASDEAFKIISFTGSSRVGWRLKTLAPKAHVVLELGGNAGVFIAADADLAWAAARCAWGAYYYSGQVCISVQRIFVEKSVHEEFRRLLVANIKELKIGDPGVETTDIGPMIDEASAVRVEQWLKEAVGRGGNLWAGGPRQGLVVPPALVEGAPADCKVCCEEVFGPVAVLEAVDSPQKALDRLADTKYGLQAGIFTNNLRFAHEAFDRLSVGGLIINDIPSYRSDAMPYGGVKESGQGREGVRYAISEFTDLRTMVVKP